MGLKALVVDSYVAEMSTFLQLLTAAEVNITLAKSADEAKRRIVEAIETGTGFDVVTTDLMAFPEHPEEGGLTFIRWLRNLDDDLSFRRILRASQVPVVVISARDPETLASRVRAIDSTSALVDKGTTGTDEILRAIDATISQYRHNIMSDLDHLGIAVLYEAGRFRLAEAYSQMATLDTKYLRGSRTQLASVCGRLFLGLDSGTFGERGIEEFEQMLNHASTSERDFHRFFIRHPEFLLAGGYSWYWSEPHLRNDETGRSIRPDFVLQPNSNAAAPWRWAVVDLKGPQVGLLRSTRFHSDFTQHVQRVIAQLRDDGEFFSHPSNTAALKSRFGGVVPRPRLIAIIGRLPGKHLDRYATISQRTPDVQITTYDELLDFRRAQLTRLRECIASIRR